MSSWCRKESVGLRMALRGEGSIPTARGGGNSITGIFLFSHSKDKNVNIDISVHM